MTKLVNDLEGALFFVSCDTTDIDDEGVTYHRDFPFTFRDGRLICFDVSPDDVDENFDMTEYNEVPRGRYNLEKYHDLKAFANAVLNREGKEYVDALYYDEELVTDNKFTFTLFNEKREAIFTYSKVVNAPKRERQVEQEEESKLSGEEFWKALSIKTKINDDKFRYDRRIFFLHVFILVAVTALVWWLGVVDGWTKIGIWLVSITSGLYFTQFWWSNAPREQLGVFGNGERRAAGRPWINGGFLIGLALVGINVVYGIYHPEYMMSFGYYYMMWWMLTLVITLVWGAIALAYRKLNKSELQEMLEGVSESIRRNNCRLGRKQFFRDLFLNMLPDDWELKIRNWHIARLDKKEQEMLGNSEEEK